MSEFLHNTFFSGCGSCVFGLGTVVITPYSAAGESVTNVFQFYLAFT